MTEWLDVDLPWCTRDTQPWPPCPDLRGRTRQQFGTDLTAAWNAIPQRYLDLHSRHREALQREDAYQEATDEAIEDELLRRHPRSVAVRQVVDYSRLRRRIDAWEEQQPEIEAYRRQCEECSRRHRERSFTGRGLNRPGTLVEVETPQGPRRYLIGHINPLAGVCDDCTLFPPDTRVLRYRVLWTDGQERV